MKNILRGGLSNNPKGLKQLLKEIEQNNFCSILLYMKTELISIKSFHLEIIKTRLFQNGGFYFDKQG